MKKLDLMTSLIKTYNNLLESQQTIESQIAEARNKINISLQRVVGADERDSVMQGAVWYNYLVEMYQKNQADIKTLETVFRQNDVSLVQTGSGFDEREL